MAYLTGTISLNVYTDTTQTEFPQENLAQITKSFQSVVVTGASSPLFALAALGSQAVDLNGAGTVTGAYICSSATDINVNINGLGNILFHSGVPAYLPATITSMTITNASSTTATYVTVMLIAG